MLFVAIMAQITAFGTTDCKYFKLGKFGVTAGPSQGLKNLIQKKVFTRLLVLRFVFGSALNKGI